jgi:guanylate kinase
MQRLLFAFAGPSGAGKVTRTTLQRCDVLLTLQSTIINEITRRYVKFKLCVSHTSRPPRAGEREGGHYYFTTRDQMAVMQQRGEFVEVQTIHGNSYGTSHAALQSIISSEMTPILDVDSRGCVAIEQSAWDAVFVQILPPSLEFLAERLRNRYSACTCTLNPSLKRYITSLCALFPLR